MNPLAIGYFTDVSHSYHESPMLREMYSRIIALITVIEVLHKVEFPLRGIFTHLLQPILERELE